MSFPALAPAELLAGGFAAPHVTGQPWSVRWDRLTENEIEELVLATLPPAVDLSTSGSTGSPQQWRRSREQMWTEAGLLAELLRPDAPEAVLASAPCQHIYGALTSVLVPARLRVPAWYRPQFFGEMPPADGRRWAVTAVPWTFSLLLRQRAWLRAAGRLTVLHSTATLPTAAADVVAEAGAGRVRIVEVFGSTETGGIASREWGPGSREWTLFDDVTLHRTRTIEGDGEVPLVVSSPRLAARPGATAPPSFATDDFVEPIGARRFRFAGRRTRLVKVNGSRVNLDELETRLRRELSCSDLALVPIADGISGESLDMLFVPHPDAPLTAVDARVAAAASMVRLRTVHLVDHIDRSETGKLRRVH